MSQRLWPSKAMIAMLWLRQYRYSPHPNHKPKQCFKDCTWKYNYHIDILIMKATILDRYGSGLRLISRRQNSCFEISDKFHAVEDLLLEDTLYMRLHEWGIYSGHMMCSHPLGQCFSTFLSLLHTNLLKGIACFLIKYHGFNESSITIAIIFKLIAL